MLLAEEVGKLEVDALMSEVLGPLEQVNAWAKVVKAGTQRRRVPGERLLVHIGRLRAADIAVAVPDIGTAVIPLTDVTRIEFGVGGGGRGRWG